METKLRGDLDVDGKGWCADRPQACVIRHLNVKELSAS